MKNPWRAAALVLLLAAFAPTQAETAAEAPAAKLQIRSVDAAWTAALPHDADAATQAYLDRLPPELVARANDYFEGGYWLILWNFLLGLAVAAILLAGRRSRRLCDWAHRTARWPFAGDALYAAAYWLAGWLLSLPLTIYQYFVREHQYNLATQTFVPWFVEQLVSLGVSLVVVAIAGPLFYRAIRAAGQRWWLAATAVAIVFQVIAQLVAPIWIDPLFNTYRPVQDGAVKTSVLALAHANGVPTDNIYEFDASRQTTRVSANVSGIFGAAAVRLNDNLLRRTSLPEIRAVMGHELGHYVLNHAYKFLAFTALVLLAGFAFTQWAMRHTLARWGARWGLGGIGDMANLPLLVAVFSVFVFVATPVFNTLVRTQEVEADRFGMDLAREPLAMAEVLLKLTEYRKPDPGPIEEWIFFDHPSTRFRIHDAMRWREAMQADGPDKPWPQAKP
ncbi:MAG: M48 family metallopeptidase [Ramlibacter sp.]